MKVVMLVIWIAFGTQTFVYNDDHKSVTTYTFYGYTEREVMDKIHKVDTGPMFGWYEWPIIRWEIGQIETESYQVNHE